MNTVTPRAAPLLLLLIVLGGHALRLRDGDAEVPRSPWACAELVVPGLFAADGASSAWPFDAASAPRERSLLWMACADGAQAASSSSAAAAPGTTISSPYAGLIPLWLGLACVLPLSTAPGVMRKVLPLALLALALAAGVWLRSSVLVVGALGLAGAVGLARIRTEEGGDRPRASVAPQLLAAAACVLLTTALIAASLRAGFATDAEALQPLLAHLDAGARASFDPARLALEAGHLRAVLDRAALAAFVGMTALLLHLKSRAPWSAGLLLVASAADVVSAAI